MDVFCTKNADNKSLVYSGTNALSKPSGGRGNSKGQETCSFEEALVEFERELSNTYQTNAIQMLNNLYQITNAKYHMLNNCDLSDEKSLRHEIPRSRANLLRYSSSISAHVLQNLNFKMEFYSRRQVSLIFNAVVIVNFQMYSTIANFSYEIQEQW